MTEAAEAALVARVFIDPSQLPLVKVGPEDFSSPLWREVFRGMRELTDQHRSIDIIALQSYAPGENLSGLIDEVSELHRAPVEEYAEMVRQAAFRRRLVGHLDRIIRKAREDAEPNELLSQLQEAFTSIVQSVESGRLISPEKAAEIYEKALEQRIGRGGTGLEWGIPELDRLIQPAKGGNMIVLAARPSVGKTTLAEILADRWAMAQGDPVLFVSLEMGVEELEDRAAARYAEVDPQKILRGNLNDEQRARVQEAIDYRRRYVKVWYLDDPYATTASVRAEAARTKMIGGGLTAIVIDYLQLLKDPGDGVQRVTKISSMTKALAREFNVPVLALSQLNRSSTFRDDPHPKLSDLRESGAIEQDADLVLGMHRELDSDITDLEVLKNRATGRVGMINLSMANVTRDN